ncbi:Trypsin [Popillia japonica]|uniref:Trypsin n=1 Tax=Popillia japonica TaxID=7064 RepID=A0AAW1NCP9_POPJA
MLLQDSRPIPLSDLASPGFVSPKFGFNPRIVGGQNATEGQFPYQISVRYYGSHNCRGSILNKHWALTAAHCVDGYSVSALNVVSGSIYLSGGGNFNNVIKVIVHSGSIYLSGGGNFNNVIKVIVHENWDPYNIKNALAVIKIDGEFDLGSNFISPIGLEHSFIEEKECVASGWGRLYGGEGMRGLRLGPLKTLLIETDCRKRWGGVPVSECEVCTLTQVGEGVCNGDSGSPLVIEGKQIGIVSWGNACANGLPDVYTRISCYD